MYLTKHHVFGNDFLVRLEADEAPCPEPDWVSRVCDRNRGLGADGLMWAWALDPWTRGDLNSLEFPPRHRLFLCENVAGPPPNVEMQLYNSDGSKAEVSGNGLACLAQAATLRTQRVDADVSIGTEVGEHKVEVRDPQYVDDEFIGDDFGRSIRHSACVGMRQATEDLGRGRLAGELLAAVPEVSKVGWVSVGNPHVVVLMERPDSLGRLDLESVGAGMQTQFEPVNLEAVTVANRGKVRMQVFERGVGITSACGSGAAAVAWQLNRWGLVDDTVKVFMPGGVAEVRVGPSVVELRVPVIYVGYVEAPEPPSPEPGENV